MKLGDYGGELREGHHPVAASDVFDSEGAARGVVRGIEGGDCVSDGLASGGDRSGCGGFTGRFGKLVAFGGVVIETDEFERGSDTFGGKWAIGTENEGLDARVEREAIAVCGVYSALGSGEWCCRGCILGRVVAMASRGT